MREKKIRRVLLITLFLNLTVSLTKILYGYYISSVSILSDGFHSLFDGISNLVGLFGLYLSVQPPDERHPYGHRKFETIFALFISVILFFTCFEIFRASLKAFTQKIEPRIEKESFILMFITIFINLFVTFYETKRGKELKSEFLLADSMHTRADLYISSTIIAGLFLFKLGFRFFDPMIGIGVGVLVAKAGFDMLRETVEILVDKRQIPSFLVKQIVCDIDGVKDCHEIRTRGTKDHIFLDLHILVDSSMPIKEAHGIADDVEKEIKNKIPQVKDVVVHIEPTREEKDG